MLSIRNLAVGYGHLPVIQDVSLVLSEGEIVPCWGEMGRGRPPPFGRSWAFCPPGMERSFLPAPLHQLRTPGIVSLGLSYVPEGKSVFPKMTVMENLELALHSPGGEEPER